MEPYIAHINEATGAVQSVKEHCENTAELCSSYAIPEMKKFNYAAGLAHDIGKYQHSFQRRIRGENIKVEHSACGSLAVGEEYPFIISLMMQYCIAGHHGGIPDGGFVNDEPGDPTLQGRLQKKFEDFSKYKNELVFPKLEENEWIRFLCGDCGQDMNRLIDKFAFLTRYTFSCLVDADFADTADFCKDRELPRRLKADFSTCLEQVNKLFQSFQCSTPLQKTRAVLQKQAFQNAGKEGEIYLLNMPTGSGKTLASVKIALEQAIASDKKRIIYIIPYNSIIDQTAEVFEELFRDNLEILRHQSTFSYEEDENITEDYREAARVAAENWDAPFIITTAVQFFESVYGNKRGKLRKMHNMADSILIFDEAHLMPRKYLQACLQAVAFLTRYLHSKAVFLTATMPDFEQLIREYALRDSKIIDLIPDKSDFKVFQKCSYKYLDRISREELAAKSRQYPSSLIIVNQKETARNMYYLVQGKKYHLSTYMTVCDRKRILQEIRSELIKLEKDYPDLQNVPEGKRITIISTSLIEAGVDLDVYTVFRERTGLDSILQAGGRCNREGKRNNAEVFIFDLYEGEKENSEDEKANLTKGLLKEFNDISAGECIQAYYNRLYFMKREEIQKYTIHQFCSDIRSIPFSWYAEHFGFIDNKTVSLVIPCDDRSRMLVETLKYTKTGNPRQFQKYTCTLYQKELEDLARQHAADDYGTGIYCLTNMDYYDRETGVQFDAKDYFVE